MIMIKLIQQVIKSLCYFQYFIIKKLQIYNLFSSFCLKNQMLSQINMGIYLLVFFLSFCDCEIITVQIKSTFDDAYEEKNGNIANTAPYILHSSQTIASYRFKLDIPRSSKVQLAQLSLRYNFGNGPAKLGIAIEDTANSEIISYRPFSISSRKLIETSQTIEIRTGLRYGEKIISKDISKLLTNIINKEGWKQDNYIMLAVTLKQGDSFEAISYDGTWGNLGLLSAQLTIQYGLSEQPIIQSQQILSKQLPQFPQQPQYSLVLQFLEAQRSQCIKKQPLDKPPIILVIDDLQTQYLQGISHEIANIHIQQNVDILLNLIPNNINESFSLRFLLSKWQRQYPCLLQIGQHGYTHQGDQYDMDVLQYEQQQKIIMNGRQAMWDIGLVSNSFTPPGGRDNNSTFQILSQMNFHTSIDWIRKKSTVDTLNITLLQNIALCEGSNGNIIGPSCKIKSLDSLEKQMDEQIKRLGYTCIGYHVQDFRNQERQRDGQKIQQYINLLREIKKLNKYQFMLPQEYYLKQKNLIQ